MLSNRKNLLRLLQTPVLAPRTLWILLLAASVLISRIAFVSNPYFVDGPNQVAAIASGKLFIQPPGYFLFDLLARQLFLTKLVSAATAAVSLNILLSTLGVIVFSMLSVCFIPGAIGILLAVFYAFSDTAWFAADIHSTYASMTFFAPALLYCLLVKERWWLIGLLWALMTGIRPSDGVFILPCLVAVLSRRRWRQLAEFTLAALPVLLFWYLPTVRHFGGHLLSPLSAAGGQVHDLANGLLVPGVPLKRKAGNVVHLALGIFNAWNILIPFLLLGLFSASRLSRIALLWCAPGALFFTAYFFSDSVYLTYMIAPGLILAGLTLQRLRKARAVLVLTCAIAFSIIQMTLLRPVQVTGISTAILDAYTLQYTGWALRHQYTLHLKDVLSAKR